MKKLNVLDYIVVPEPPSPGAAKRLSSVQKNCLLAQRRLATAIMAEDLPEISDCLITLGFVEDAARLTNDVKLVESFSCPDDEWCACDPQHMTTTVGREAIITHISNYMALRPIFPDKHEWYCISCGRTNISSQIPPSALRMMEARANQPGRGEGPDHLVNPRCHNEFHSCSNGDRDLYQPNPEPGA